MTIASQFPLRVFALAALVASGAAQAQTTVAAWTFEGLPTTGSNNSPAASTGTGVATSLGMTNSYNSTSSLTYDDIVAGVTTGTKPDTGANGQADASLMWRIRGGTVSAGGTPNGWSSQAPIGTQGAQFAASTVGYSGPITVSFDWYATTQGEANLQLQYTTDGVNYQNLAINIGANANAGLQSLTNSTSANTVTGAYISDNKTSSSLAGQDWFQGLTATINNAAADNDPNFAIRLVNASTGTDNVSTQGTALNNTSGNWRFDNVSIAAAAVSAVPEPQTWALMLGGLGAVGAIVRRKRRA